MLTAELAQVVQVYSGIQATRCKMENENAWSLIKFAYRSYLAGSSSLSEASGLRLH